jgi:hypothetical protein
MRELILGSGGQIAVTYLIVDHVREVHVLVVQWFC